jgi:hypothetical protein
MWHVQCEEPETAILTVDSRVFDVCAPKVMCFINNGEKTFLLDVNQEQYAK